jgi:3-hydroxybutyryl-CoA dehydratase
MSSDKIPSERQSEIGWNDIEVGKTQAENYELTEKVYGHFLALSGDTNPIHVSDEEAVQRGFLKKVMHGGILHGFISNFVGMRFPGNRSLLLKTDLRYLHPCHLHDRLRLEAVVSHKTDAAKVLVLDLRIFREPEHVIVAAGQSLVRVQE